MSSNPQSLAFENQVLPIRPLCPDYHDVKFKQTDASGMGVIWVLVQIVERYVVT